MEDSRALQLTVPTRDSRSTGRGLAGSGFLDWIEAVEPWDELCAVVEAHYPSLRGPVVV